jgi:hypothetical protein
VSSPRIQFLTFKRKQILLVDFSRLSADEVEKIARTVPEVVTTRARSSVLLLRTSPTLRLNMRPCVR